MIACLACHSGFFALFGMVSEHGFPDGGGGESTDKHGEGRLDAAFPGVYVVQMLRGRKGFGCSKGEKQCGQQQSECDTDTGKKYKT